MSKRKHQQQTRRAVRKVLNSNSDDPAPQIRRGWSRDMHIDVIEEKSDDTP